MQTITVDMTPGFRQPTIHYSQNDVGTTFAIDLRSRFGDTLPASPTVKIQATKPSGFGFSIEADSVVDSVATFTTVATMTDEAGRFLAELEVSDSGVVLYTANFYMEGEANPHPEGTIDGSQETVIPTLTLLVERVEAAASSVLDMTVNATTLAAGSQATYSYDEDTNTATFGIPQGEAGAGAAGVVASAYSASSTYAVGDYVIHNSNLYRCTTAITTAEAFTAAHWTQIVLADDVSDLKSDIANINGQLKGEGLDKRVVKNSYVTNRGGISPHNGWDRSDFLLVDGIRTLKVISSEASSYNVFYDASKTKIPAYNDVGATSVIHIVQGENIVQVPPNAKWAIFSGTAAYTEGLIIEPMQTVDEFDTAEHTEYIQTNLSGKQVYVLDLGQIEIGKIIRGDGTESASSVACITGYIPIYRPENKYKVECDGFSFYIVQYRRNPNGTYTWKDTQSTYSNSGASFLMDRDTTHIKIVFKMTDGLTMIESRAEMFCDAFVMREERDINKYIRVCTWNQAANTEPFRQASRADTLQRKLNYLNMLGEHNPDIVCAQEAVTDYFVPTNFGISTLDVFDRKYRFANNPGSARKNWTKYQYTRAQKIMFASQDPEENDRFFTKMLVHYEGVIIAVLNTHCTFGGYADFDSYRKGQFEELLSEMRSNEYCICCGDFNAYSANEFNVFTNGGMRIANCGDFGQFDTWDPYHVSQRWPFSGLDNIVVTPNINIEWVFEGPYDFSKLSDHKALFADLQIV